MKKSHFRIYLLIGACTVLGAVAYFWHAPHREMITCLLTQAQKKITRIYDRREHWITVFIHGNFNTGLGLLNIARVIKDDITGTTYEKMLTKIRNDEFFYQEQPILQVGLHKLHPTLDRKKNMQKFAAYPIIASYKEVLESITPNREINHFYTFGWSGILSQKHRRRDALRLYNALCEEAAHLTSQGIHPRIRLVIHSHGGNVALNMAAINEAQSFFRKAVSTIDSSAEHTKQREAMLTLLKEVPTREQAQHKTGQQRLDYRPHRSTPLIIDELVLLGTPMQPETQQYLYSSTFKKVYSFYSDQDIIQVLDWVTTKQRFSMRRLSSLLSLPNRRFSQAKIMIDHPLTKRQEAQKQTWWKQLPLDQVLPSESKDPTHKNLWFLAWNQEFCQPNFPLDPLPLVVIVPWLTHVIDNIQPLDDVDLNFVFDKEHITISVLKHDDTLVRKTFRFPAQMLAKLKRKIEPWRPQDLTRSNTFKHMSSKRS